MLDLGTGNGSMLMGLRDAGFGELVGVDYSEKSVQLARRLWEQRGGEEGDRVRFEVWDVMRGLGADGEIEKGLDWFPYEKGGFEIVLDKGTFDAISLSAEEVVEGGDDGDNGVKGSRKVVRRVCELYPKIAKKMVRRGGFLLVTSCNWTESELIRWFVGDEKEGEKEEEEDKLTVFNRLSYPKFRFGGQEGQGVCTVCFKRKGGELYTE